MSCNEKKQSVAKRVRSIVDNSFDAKWGTDCKHASKGPILPKDNDEPIENHMCKDIETRIPYDVIKSLVPYLYFEDWMNLYFMGNRFLIYSITNCVSRLTTSNCKTLLYRHYANVLNNKTCNCIPTIQQCRHPVSSALFPKLTSLRIFRAEYHPAINLVRSPESITQFANLTHLHIPVSCFASKVIKHLPQSIENLALFVSTSPRKFKFGHMTNLTNLHLHAPWPGTITERSLILPPKLTYFKAPFVFIESTMSILPSTISHMQLRRISCRVRSLPRSLVFLRITEFIYLIDDDTIDNNDPPPFWEAISTSYQNNSVSFDLPHTVTDCNNFTPTHDLDHSCIFQACNNIRIHRCPIQLSHIVTNLDSLKHVQYLRVNHFWIMYEETKSDSLKQLVNLDTLRIDISIMAWRELKKSNMDIFPTSLKRLEFGIDCNISSPTAPRLNLSHLCLPAHLEQLNILQFHKSLPKNKHSNRIITEIVCSDSIGNVEDATLLPKLKRIHVLLIVDSRKISPNGCVDYLTKLSSNLTRRPGLKATSSLLYKRGIGMTSALTYPVCHFEDFSLPVYEGWGWENNEK